MKESSQTASRKSQRSRAAKLPSKQKLKDSNTGSNTRPNTRPKKDSNKKSNNKSQKHPPPPPVRSGATAKNQPIAKIPYVKPKSRENTVEFRFHCSPELRERMNDRLTLLGLNRSDIMIEFLEEWLRQTDVYLGSASSSAATKDSADNPRAQK